MPDEDVDVSTAARTFGRASDGRHRVLGSLASTDLDNQAMARI
jgi:hypothetical protein